jgi:hypothetical protein
LGGQVKGNTSCGGAVSGGHRGFFHLASKRRQHFVSGEFWSYNTGGYMLVNKAQRSNR